MRWYGIVEFAFVAAAIALSNAVSFWAGSEQGQEDGRLQMETIAASRGYGEYAVTTDGEVIFQWRVNE